MRNRYISLLVPTLLVAVALSGCGLFGPPTYEPDERSIEVEPGDEFALSVPADPGYGQDWYLTRPHPDSAVVKRVGERRETEGSDSGVEGGSDGTRLFAFRAVTPGTTKIKLIHCPAKSCTATDDRPDPHPTSPQDLPVPTATSSPGTNPEYFVYTVTVR